MHRPRSRERRQRFPARRNPVAESNSGNADEESSPVQQNDHWHLGPSSSRQSAEPAPNPPPQVIKIPMKKLRDFQIQQAAGTITKEQTMAMFTEIPWDALQRQTRPAMPSFSELHPEQPGKENYVGHKPRPFDPERNEDGSAKLIPWGGCARARVWIKKPYKRKFWRYDTEHVRRKTQLESYQRDLKKMHREPTFLEVQQLENYKKKTEQAAALLLEEGEKTLAKMREEEAEKERQKERDEEIERRKFEYSLISPSQLWEVKEAMKPHFHEYLTIFKHTKQNSSNRTAGHFKNFRMQRATDNYTLEMPLAAPPMQMRIKSSNVVITHEVVGLSTTKDVDWDNIWFTQEEQETDDDQERDPEEGTESVMGEQPSEANTSPREDFLHPDDVDSRHETDSPMESEAEYFAQLTYKEKMERLIRKHNEDYEVEPPVTGRSAPASFNRKLMMKERREELLELAKKPFITRDQIEEKTFWRDRRIEHKRRTNTPVTEGQTRETSPAVVNQIETPRKKDQRKEQRPVLVQEHHWEAILHEKEKKEQEANGQEDRRPQIPAIIPNMGQQEYVRNCVAAINYQAEMAATMPQYGMEMREHPYGTDSQATSPAIMEEEITNEFIGELMDEIAAETIDEEQEIEAEELTEAVEENVEKENVSVQAMDEEMDTERPIERPVQGSEPVEEAVILEKEVAQTESIEEPADEPSENFMEEFVEIFSPPSPMSSPRPVTSPSTAAAPSPAVVVPSQHPAPIRMSPEVLPGSLPPIDTVLSCQPKKFLVRDPVTQQLIPSSGAVIMRNSPPGSTAVPSPVEMEPKPLKAVVEPAPKKIKRSVLSPSTSQPIISQEPRSSQDETRRKSNAGKVTQRIDPHDFPPVTIKKRGRPTKAESAKRAARRVGLTPPDEMVAAQEIGTSSPVSTTGLAVVSPGRVPLKKRKLGDEQLEDLGEPSTKTRNVGRSKEAEEPSRLNILVEEELEMTTTSSNKLESPSVISRKGREVPLVSSSSTTSDSDPPKKKSRRQRIRENQEAVRQEAREQEAHKLAVQKEAASLAAEILAAGRLRESRESTVSGNNSLQVSPLPLETQPTTNPETSPEVERSYREISIPVETQYGMVFTSPRSSIPLDSRFATDLAMAHPKSRTRRQAAIRRAEEAAQREATSSPATSTAHPAPSPDFIQLEGPSRESSMAVEDLCSESSSVYLATAPKKRFLQRAQTIQQLEPPPPEPAPDVQLLSPPVREPPSDDDDIMIIEQVEKDPAEIKREAMEALEQATAPVPKVTDREYDEDGEDEPPLGYPLIYAYDFMEIDREEITTDMIPFPPEAARVDGACFTHLLYRLVQEEMRTHLPRLTDRYAPYSQDLLSFFESVSPRYLNENNLKLALEDPAQLVNIALNSLSDDAILVLTTVQDTVARKKQLVTSLKIRGIMTLFLQSRKDLLEELASAVYGSTDGPEYEKLKEQFDASMNNIQIAICDNLMGLAKETKDPKWQPTKNVLKRRFEAFYFGWRGFILRGGPLKCFSNMFQNNGMANEVNNTLEIWFQRLNYLLVAISHELIKEPVIRASELVHLFEKNKQRAIQWEAALADVRDESSDGHQFGCQECKVYFTNRKYLEEHEDLHEYKPYECGVDYLGFSHQVSLYLHYLHRHLKDILSGEITVPPVFEYS